MQMSLFFPSSQILTIKNNGMKSESMGPFQTCKHSTIDVFRESEIKSMGDTNMWVH